MVVRLHNTMTRSIDEFEPIDRGKVGLYTCGPTVYQYAHIGNLRTYVFEDVLKRVLEEAGFEVRHVMNVTDVGHLVSDADTGDDKMEKSAAKQGKTIREIADFYWEAFRKDMRLLNVREPDVWCKATDHIAEQIELIRRLEERGFTYRLDDGLYFDTLKLKDYGKLARLDRDGLLAGARIEMVEGKKSPTDFALWKFSPKDKQRLMEWESPWGTGFPGWHLECSAMSLRYLGERFDIHCGGVDHIAIHHTNEIAQVEAAYGHDWVRWWMHGEFLVLPAKGEEGETTKMAKSGENFVTISSVIDRGIDPLAYRLFCLNAHYRAPLTFTWESLGGCANALGRLRNRVGELRKKGAGSPSEKHRSDFLEACADDLNMPRALAVFWGVLREEALSVADRYATLLAMDRVLGLGVESMEEEKASLDAEAEDLVRRRDEARKRRDFAEADRLRDELLARGYVLEDTPGGTRARRKEREIDCG
ncbi:MAG: cysteine--tRNA ligase [Candidatus Latescibacterota bacterium]|nr:MAG: cysteine--tRNA ligase [Candidatus Latescibacterota bacterium]